MMTKKMMMKQKRVGTAADTATHQRKESEACSPKQNFPAYQIDHRLCLPNEQREIGNGN
jgi:hypothetical protein